MKLAFPIIIDEYCLYFYNDEPCFETVNKDSTFYQLNHSQSEAQILQSDPGGH